MAVWTAKSCFRNRHPLFSSRERTASITGAFSLIGAWMYTSAHSLMISRKTFDRTFALNTSKMSVSLQNSTAGAAISLVSLVVGGGSQLRAAGESARSFMLLGYNAVQVSTLNRICILVVCLQYCAGIHSATSCGFRALLRKL